MAGIEDIRQRVWDFWLTVVTVIVLALLGVQSFIGTGYVWWAERSIPSWEQSAGYTSYVALMNAIAAPLVLVLVLVMGLCVPKRLFSRTALIGVSVVMVAVGAGAWAYTKSLATGLAVYLALAAIIQVAVVVMTVAGVRGPSYLTEGRLTKTGSGLLHLGFILFGLVVVDLQSSTWMLPVFSVSALLAIVGTALSFYARKLAWRRRPPQEEVAFSWARDAEGDVDDTPAEDADAETPEGDAGE